MRNIFKSWDPEKQESFIADYKVMADIDVAKKYDISIVTVKRTKSRLHIKKDEQYMAEIYHKNHDRMMSYYNDHPEGFKIRANAMKVSINKRHAAERRRILYGLPQKTKYTYTFDKQRMQSIYQRRCYLRYYRKYILVRNDLQNVYYDDNTKRTVELEEIYSRDYNLCFRHISDINHDEKTEKKVLARHDYMLAGE